MEGFLISCVINSCSHGYRYLQLNTKNLVFNIKLNENMFTCSSYSDTHTYVEMVSC